MKLKATFLQTIYTTIDRTQFSVDDFDADI